MSGAATRPNTLDMVLVHRAFRREFRLLPQVVRSVAPNDIAHAQRVAAHYDELAEMLEHHHQGEDDLVWPKLLERSQPDENLVSRMQVQHQSVSTLLETSGEMLARWRGTADPTTGSEWAKTLGHLSEVLDDHLADEEQSILPLIERHLTVQEWREVGETGLAVVPKNRLLVLLGALFEDAAPAEQAQFLRDYVPLPGRILYTLVGRRQHLRETSAVRAGITPGQSQQ